MRKSITTLQTAQRLVSGTEHLTPELVQEVAGIIPVGVIEALLVDCKSNNFSRIQKSAKEIIDSGFSVDQVFLQLSPQIVNVAHSNLEPNAIQRIVHFVVIFFKDPTIADKHKAAISIRS